MHISGTLMHIVYGNAGHKFQNSYFCYTYIENWQI